MLSIIQGHSPGFTKIVKGTFQNEAVFFKVMQLEPSNLAIIYLTQCIKSQKPLRISKKDYMNKIKSVEDGAKLQYRLPIG